MNVANNILEAIDIITTNRLAQGGFDKTVAATVKLIKDIDKQSYIVTINGVDYTAFNNTEFSYAINDQVYVLVPGGDYANRLLIMGN
jgi:hypothetical protein